MSYQVHARISGTFHNIYVVYCLLCSYLLLLHTYCLFTGLLFYSQQNILLILKYYLYYILQNVFLSIYSHLNKGCSYKHYFHKIPQVFSNTAFTLI